MGQEDRVIDISIEMGLNIASVPWTLGHSIWWVMDTNPQFNPPPDRMSGACVRLNARVSAALQKAQTEKEPLRLKEEDWKVLSDIFEAPAMGYVPPLSQQDAEGHDVPINIPARQFLPLVDGMSDEATKPKS